MKLIHESDKFLIQYEVKDYSLEFEVFRPNAWGVDEKTKEFTVKCYGKRGGKDSMDTTELLSEAERIMEGGLKWDGCLNLNYYPDEEGYVHYCGLDSALFCGEIMKEIYKLGPKIKTWDKTLAN